MIPTRKTSRIIVFCCWYDFYFFSRPPNYVVPPKREKSGILCSAKDFDIESDIPNEKIEKLDATFVKPIVPESKKVRDFCLYINKSMFVYIFRLQRNPSISMIHQCSIRMNRHWPVIVHWLPLIEQLQRHVMAKWFRHVSLHDDGMKWMKYSKVTLLVISKLFYCLFLEFKPLSENLPNPDDIIIQIPNVVDVEPLANDPNSGERRLSMIQVLIE